MAEDTDQVKALRKEWRIWKFILSLFVWLWAALGLGAMAIALVAFLVYEHVTQDGMMGPIATLHVPQGATGQDVGRMLADDGFIEHEAFFRIAIKLDGGNAVIRHGEYDLSRGQSATQLLHQLEAGPTREALGEQVAVTIPEGLSIDQMATRFEHPDAFLAAAADAEFRKRLGVEAATLEGYLMPNTYFFDGEPTERDVVERMVEQFETEYAALAEQMSWIGDYDINQVLTVASLVEEEARVDDERPIVAAVMYNRLDKGMLLQMDSTLQFALKKYGQRMLNVDKEVESPYNTYKYKGLPPGPISNPGIASIRAALQPAEADYLYFVSNADGNTHTFSKTLGEHNRAVARYNREMKQQRP